MTEYAYTTQPQVRAAFWVGWPAGFRRGTLREQYDEVIRSEFVDFVDMLVRDGHISKALAQCVTL